MPCCGPSAGYGPTRPGCPRTSSTSAGSCGVTPELRVPGHDSVFAVGDVAATDPLRSSARNWADGLLARNVSAYFTGGRMRGYRPPASRVGIGTGCAARRAGSVRTQRVCVPIPVLVDRPGAAAMDRPPRHLPWRAVRRSVHRHQRLIDGHHVGGQHQGPARCRRCVRCGRRRAG